MPSVTFSATVSFGEPSFADSPSMMISPSSGWVSPYRTFISVVFPAPFSPSRAWTWPGATSRLILSLATRKPNLLVMPLSSSSTDDRPCLADRALGGHLDRPVLDLGLQGLQLGLQRGGHLGRVVVVRREPQRAVAQRADEVAALERARRGG